MVAMRNSRYPAVLIIPQLQRRPIARNCTIRDSCPRVDPRVDTRRCIHEAGTGFANKDKEVRVCGVDDGEERFDGEDDEEVNSVEREVWAEEVRGRVGESDNDDGNKAGSCQ